MNPNIILGKRLRACRQQACLSQFEVGTGIGLGSKVARSRISRYESGVHAPSLETAYSLANFYNVPISYLYCDDDILADIIKYVSRLPVHTLTSLLEQLESNQS